MAPRNIAGAARGESAVSASILRRTTMKTSLGRGAFSPLDANEHGVLRAQLQRGFLRVAAYRRYHGTGLSTYPTKL
jgi:hypothetical protein